MVNGRRDSKLAGRVAIRKTRKQKREEILFGVGKCSLGFLLVGVSEKGVVAIVVGRDREMLVQELYERFMKAELVRADGDVAEEMGLVVDYIERPRGGLALELDIRGTAFRKRVWEAVLKIPVGKTSTYSKIAEKIGAPKAVRAVGSACTNNPLAFAVPCHRVLHKDGTGSERQLMLIGREARGK